MFNKTFASLKHRNYRLFFFGQIVSLTGTWIHWTAQQWLVYILTGSKAYLGIIAACQTLPMLLFAVFGGIIADRYSKKKILIIAQWLLMFSAFAMGALVLSGKVEVWHVALLAIISGICAAFAMPARQTFVMEIVGRDDLMNAVGLNSSIFNSARVLGPAIAGMVMSQFDIGWCFVLNGFSFIASITSLLMMKIEIIETSKIESIWGSVKEGFQYVYKTKDLFWLFVMVSIVGIFGISHTILVPAFAKDILLVGEWGYGFMMTATGIGALLAALTVATLGTDKNRKKLIVLGMTIFSIAAGIFAVSTNYYLSLFALMLAGCGITTFVTSANTLVQLSTADNIRGRVMGIWTFVFGGMMPIGSLQVGLVAERIGPKNAVLIGVGICAVAIMVFGLYFLRKQES